jgi:hypothetical protein
MAISDGVVIGIVLGLIFAAVSYYLFTRQTQLERKVGLMENILLDLRVTTEQALVSATEPEQHDDHDHQEHQEHQEHKQKSSDADAEVTYTEYKPITEVDHPSSPKETQSTPLETLISRSEKEQTTVSNNYEAMTYKELTHLARQKGISGLRNMSKAQVIDALRALEGGSSSTTTQPIGTQVPLSAWMTDDSDTKIQSEELSSANDTLDQHLASFTDEAVEVSLVGSD